MCDGWLSEYYQIDAPNPHRPIHPPHFYSNIIIESTPNRHQCQPETCESPHTAHSPVSSNWKDFTSCPAHIASMAFFGTAFFIFIISTPKINLNQFNSNKTTTTSINNYYNYYYNDYYNYFRTVESDTNNGWNFSAMNQISSCESWLICLSRFQKGKKIMAFLWQEYYYDLKLLFFLGNISLFRIILIDEIFPSPTPAWGLFSQMGQYDKDVTVDARVGLWILFCQDLWRVLLELGDATWQWISIFKDGWFELGVNGWCNLPSSTATAIYIYTFDEPMTKQDRECEGCFEGRIDL